jgi:hypothetical protein
MDDPVPEQGLNLFFMVGDFVEVARAFTNGPTGAD